MRAWNGLHELAAAKGAIAGRGRPLKELGVAALTCPMITWEHHPLLIGGNLHTT